MFKDWEYIALKNPFYYLENMIDCKIRKEKKEGESLENTWLTSEVRTILIPQPVESALTPQIQYQKSADCGSPVGCWEQLDGVCGETVFHVREKTRFTLPCDLRAHMRQMVTAAMKLKDAYSLEEKL